MQTSRPIKISRNIIWQSITLNILNKEWYVLGYLNIGISKKRKQESKKAQTRYFKKLRNIWNFAKPMDLNK